MAVFLHAAMRPGLGAGPRTALIAAAVVWLPACASGIPVMWEMGIVSGTQATVWIGSGLAEVCPPTLAGARLYRE